MVGMARPRGHFISRHAWDDTIKHSGLTLADIEERTGIKRASISGLLGGHSRASTVNAGRLAAALGVHVETLFPTLHTFFMEDEEAVNRWREAAA